MKINPRAGACSTPASIPGRIFLSLFFLIFFAAGCLFEIFFAKTFLENATTYQWKATPATILASNVEPPRRDDEDPTFHVRYGYVFQGRDYTSESYQTGTDRLRTKDAYQLAGRLATGTQLTCYVDPNQPTEAVLHRKSLWAGLTLLFPLIFVAVGAGGIWFAWRPKANSSVASTSISNKVPSEKFSRRVRLGVAAFFSIFLLAGIIACYHFFIKPVLGIQQASIWPAVSCEIISSRVKTHDGDNSTTYSVDIVYRYSFNQRTYTSNRYQFQQGSSSNYRGKAAVVSQFPVGSRVACYVNPDDPTEAVIERGFTAGLWFGLIPLVFVVVGAGGVWFACFGKSRIASTALTTGAALNHSTGYRQDFSADESDGPAVLKPSSSRLGKFVGLTIFGLIWNGIISIFLFNILREWKRGTPWFLTLFFIPFGAVGLGVIGGAIYQFMALFNPKLRLTVNQRALAPGETLEISWEMEGRTDRLRELHIFLEGREEATYRRGTDTKTDKEVFATLPLITLNDPQAMRTGSAKLKLPARTMHSFKSENNRVIWSLRVKGAIPRWPDINDEFPFTIKSEVKRHES